MYNPNTEMETMLQKYCDWLFEVYPKAPTIGMNRLFGTRGMGIFEVFKYLEDEILSLYVPKNVALIGGVIYDDGREPANHCILIRTVPTFEFYDPETRNDYETVISTGAQHRDFDENESLGCLLYTSPSPRD